MDTSEWKIVVHEMSRGDKPIDEFFKKQQPTTRAKIVHNIRLLQQYGNQLTMPHAFKKKTPKTPQRELDLAIERMKSLTIV